MITRPKIQPVNGMLLFLRYAFAPNYFRYCGPREKGDFYLAILGQYKEKHLLYLLNQFEAAVPYLALIARSNQIRNYFDPRVVEAYWLGNPLISNVSKKTLFNHLKETAKKRPGKKFLGVESGISLGAKPHHSYHVFDIYRLAGKTADGSEIAPIIEVMNKCRISCGKATAKDQRSKIKNQKYGKFITVKSDKIVTDNGKLSLVESEVEAKDPFGVAREGDLVSMHWGFVCDKIEPRQAKNLNFWTKYHLGITNRK